LKRFVILECESNFTGLVSVATAEYIGEHHSKCH
jgi:hypothetical protein